MSQAYALNAMFFALAVGVAYGWTRSLRGGVACFAAVVALASMHPAVLSSDWMPYLYVPAYIAFLVAAASVAAGGTRDTWILTLAGWFLIHGHVSFLFFVPVICSVVLAAALWRRRHSLGAGPAAARTQTLRCPAPSPRSPRAGGRMIVLRFGYQSWPDVTGFLVQAERTGVRACVANPASALVVTSQFICTRSDTADGQVYWLTPAAPRGHAVIMRLRQAMVTAGSTDHS